MYDYLEIKELNDRYHFGTYRRLPVLLVEGKGSRVRDNEGNEYLDLLGGIAVNALGHCHPKVVDAIQQQASKLIHCSNLYHIGPQAHLARLLLENCDMDRIFFCNSGTEAVEGAMKLSRKWASSHGRGGKIITMEGSFHGRSLAALTATGQRKYHEGMDPLPTGFATVPFNDIDAVKAIAGDDTCAVMVEPVQGEGGIRIASREYLKDLRDLCNERGILLVFDEIQCGMGRTGHLFAYQGFDVVPDIITIAKAMGGGFPIGAFLAREEIASSFQGGDHGSTFGGSPLASAAGLAAVSSIIEEGLPKRAKDLGVWAIQRLQKELGGSRIIKDIRGMGLMIGVELKRDGKEVEDMMFKRRMLINCTAGHVLRFLPPLNISREDLNEGLDAFIKCLKEVDRHE
ncbi:MAG: aspartate aminotransferase family protein [Candidatus Thermoplasmatota archaeon]|nr:aspartate aminotransferase family protein [Candidatus Thermoplasmatota archaeon]